MTVPDSIGRFRRGELLGTGGMGQVFASTDTRTGERVALKILSQDALSDASQRERFAQEAKTIGLLQHPNIVKLRETGIVKVEGSEYHYIAMELVEGRTLDELIPPGGMPVVEAIRLALPILSALAAAHAAGVLHRDLKPRNIMVSEAGVPKVLDFGLAKRFGPRSTGSGDPTISMSQSLTMTGTIVGTAAYMSPEQAEGKKADERSDVFSMGSILYEMMTGKRAFSGDSPISTLSAVLLKEPEPLATMAKMPPAIAGVIERCMRKDPNRRHQSIADVMVSLEDALAEMDKPEPVPPPPPRRRIAAAMAVAAAGGMLPGAYLGRKYWRPPAPDPIRLTYRRGDILNARFGPNGTVVYCAAWGSDPPRTFVGEIGNREARPIDLPEGSMLAISSKGDIAMRLGSEPIGTLARAPIGGGTPREILEHVTTADWAPDGESMAIVRRVGGSFRLEYPVGNVLLANQVRKPDHLRISPDGSTAAIMVYDAEGGDFSLTLFSAGKQPRAIARSFRMVGGLAWTPDGSAVLLGAARTGSAPAIYRIDLSGRMSPAYRMPGWPQLMDTAGNGDLLVAAINSRLGITALTPFHSRLQDLAWLDGSLVADLSADGTMLLFGEISAGDGRHAAIYLRKTDGSPAVRIGFGNRFTLSQDGKFVACLRTGPKGSFAVVLPAGPGEERVLPPDGRRNEAVECHPDGRRLLITSSANGSSQTFLRPIAGGEASAVTQPGVIASKISPDGKFALARAGEKLRLIPLDGGRAQDVVSLKSGEQPCRWAPDGRSVFLAAVDHGGHSVEISRIEMSTGRRERWKQLAPVEPGAVFWGTPALSADGQSYAVSFRQDLGELYLIKNVI